MNVSPLAGKPAEESMLVNIPRLVSAYYTETPVRRLLEEAQAIVSAALADQAGG
ncbi:hypothetical protein K2Z83_12130 [Oscillochloris sp. ZM17-4]|uniref:hypothetical protein n=1 Tax=Oscillochloris sp. ZM17-4 TaxID=2866714 RepID=UPI001C736014|nr:hypothetical protein [Oscillochloris sp. ZM17-4]MBX0328424.1 hypothetical protein [Oscillochloris sp. ZM17-4]